MRVRSLRVLLWLLMSGLLAGCGEEPGAERHPWVVIGIDGMEWTVIERLWQDGRLPALRSMVDSGSRTSLLTDYTASPVIWTTIATGVKPGRHGITDFVVPTERGDVPVSSSVRKAPTI